MENNPKPNGAECEVYLGKPSADQFLEDTRNIAHLGYNSAPEPFNGMTRDQYTDAVLNGITLDPPSTSLSALDMLNAAPPDSIEDFGRFLCNLEFEPDSSNNTFEVLLMLRPTWLLDYPFAET